MKIKSHQKFTLLQILILPFFINFRLCTWGKCIIVELWWYANIRYDAGSCGEKERNESEKHQLCIPNVENGYDRKSKVWSWKERNLYFKELFFFSVLCSKFNVHKQIIPSFIFSTAASNGFLLVFLNHWHEKIIKTVSFKVP